MFHYLFYRFARSRMRILTRLLFLLSILFALLPAATAAVLSVEQVYEQMMTDLVARRNEQLVVRRVEKIARGVAGLAAGLGAHVSQEWR
ncbi:hypothetical protein FOZ60_006420 [Perkinsus olseni]|uniref:Uncharacterized protein n=1 Tax=Perkinsus olseni TaxID=32597 RepID=A0A7J6NR59_PEROL|nr:hypothetical protein FOZ60_006420 [Perkinsus olseni]